MDCAIRIAEYCEKHLIEKPNFSEFIIKKPNFIFQLINSDKLYDEALQAIILVKRSNSLQTLMHKKIENELMEIQNSNFDFVGMKGFFLEKAYYPSKYVRFYNDIDILVKSKNGYKSYHNLIRHRFSLIKTKGVGDNKNYSIFLLRRYYFKLSHHVILCKKCNPNIVNLTLELHSNINKCNSGKLNFNIDKMIDNSIEKEFEGIKYKIFSPEDNLGYLMFHSIKHLSYTSFIKNQNCMVNLQHFYDVAQIINTETIKWEIFERNVFEAGIVPFVSLYLKMFVDIFPNLVPENTLKRIYFGAEQQDFLWKKIYSIVIKYKPCDIIIGDFNHKSVINHYFEIAKKSANPKKVWKDYCLNIDSD